MTKSQLIERLQKIEGDPEIILTVVDGETDDCFSGDLNAIRVLGDCIELEATVKYE